MEIHGTIWCSSYSIFSINYISPSTITRGIWQIYISIYIPGTLITHFVLYLGDYICIFNRFLLSIFIKVFKLFLYKIIDIIHVILGCISISLGYILYRILHST